MVPRLLPDMATTERGPRQARTQGPVRRGENAHGRGQQVQDELVLRLPPDKATTRRGQHRHARRTGEWGGEGPWPKPMGIDTGEERE